MGERLHIAFATSRALGAFAPDDRGAAAALEQRGARVTAAVWTDPEIDWSAFDAVVIRSTWDYHLEPLRFASWIDRLEESRAAIWNPPDLLRWSSHKSYLLELRAAGVPVIETALVAPGEPLRLLDAMDRLGTDALVVKPAVGATAFRSERIGRKDAALVELRLDRIRDRAWIIQPYVREIETAGEWSLVFLGGSYSHAVLKRPARGDYRVQSEYGGSAVSAVPPAAAVRVAADALAASPGDALYARVDLVDTKRGPLLMELELVEPQLFFGSEPQAVARFADTILGGIPPAVTPA